ncbi:MAG: DUF4832 domain-containing protein [Phycisphaerae bacterium]|nr:DUF4832 domain-containing protein [Phycisphaerae bacterium]
MDQGKIRRLLCGSSILTLGLCAALYAYDTVDQDIVVIRPEEYKYALRNPIKGFTNRGFSEHNEWATLVHCYIRWNQIENDESDGIDKIRQWCDTAWQGVAQRNQKVVPRVYLHWSGDRRYWPADMTPDDYTSEQFVQRVTRLVKRLGICWDTDPRVAYLEMGIIGKWGEHHSPSPTPEIEALLGRAFEDAFPHKQVLVRHPWTEFLGHGFGGYWDSWAHASQMDSHGKGYASLGNRWRTSLIGGETAYDWGKYKEQPGDSPTDTVSDPVHCNFLIDTIRSLHCTQLRWVSDYDQENALARDGAEEVQKAFGYRYVVKEIRYPRRIESGHTFHVAFDVINTGSAPFYYRWPVELSLLQPGTGRPVWQGQFTQADIRQWTPGDRWDASLRDYSEPAKLHTVSGSFMLDQTVSPGEYDLALAVLDPAGQVPSLRFAVKHYREGGRHPVGRIGVGMKPGTVTLDSSLFDDPKVDQTLRYVTE